MENMAVYNSDFDILISLWNIFEMAWHRGFT